MNSVKDKMRDGLLAEFFKVTENSPQSICRSADGGEIGDNKENKSNQIKSNQIKSNHFYCHITTAQVPW